MVVLVVAGVELVEETAPESLHEVVDPAGDELTLPTCWCWTTRCC